MLGTFVFPFLFPLRIPVFSPVYTAGGNNRVGAMAAAFVSVVATLLCWRFRLVKLPSEDRPTESERPASAWMWGVMGVVVAAAATLGALMVRQGTFYADAGYFLTQLRAGMVFHKTLYREVEFAYGPVLYYWPVLFLRVLGWLHLSAQSAYVISLCVMEAAGTAMLFFSISKLPMHRHMKIAAFVLLAIITLDPQEGLNYTAFRFVFAIASLIVLAQQRTVARAATVAGLAAMANFGVSPEMGFAFVTASAVYGLYRLTREGFQWAAVVLAAVTGGTVFALLVGPDYFRTLKEFAGGGYNMMLEPAPHIYVLLFCALVLAPIVAATALADGSREVGTIARNGMLLGLLIMGLSLLPAAFGRCDPLHVAFNGWPLYLLSFIALDRMRPQTRRIGIAIAFVFCTYSVAQEYALGSGAIRKLVTQAPNTLDAVDLPGLQQALGAHRVSFPWYTPMRAGDHLAATGNFQPLYLCIPAVDAAAEQRTVQNMREADYTMAPRLQERVSENRINNEGIKFRFRFGYRYRARHKPFLQGLLLTQELATNWQYAGTFGAYDLYRKVR